MSAHSSHNINEARDKTHHERLHVDLITSEHRLHFPKLSPEERMQHHHNRHKVEPTSSNDSLFRLFKDQNTIDILRHKNLNEFKHKAVIAKQEDFEIMMREIELQKDEVIKEMKIWTRVAESALKGEVKFSETDYSELHSAFYKWLLFIEESYTSYEKIENSLPPPLIHHSPNIHNNYNEEMIKKSPHAHLTHSKLKEDHQKEVQRLNMIIKDLNTEIEASKIKKTKYENKIDELQTFLTEEEERNKKYQARAKEVNKKIVDVVTESEQFLNELKNSINEGKDLKCYLQKLQEKLVLLREFKDSFK